MTDIIDGFIDSVLAVVITAYVCLCAIAPFALVGSFVAIAISMWAN